VEFQENAEASCRNARLSLDSPLQACKEMLLELSIQNLPVRRISLSAITCLGIPNLAMTALPCAMEVEVGMKLVYVASLSMTTRIFLYPLETGSSGVNSTMTASKG
jgi:hypothetical protein